MKNNNTKLIVIRHGETEWNKIGRQQGHLDSPLTEAGIRQAQAAGERLTAERIDIIYSSDLGRARQTAEIINEHLGLEIILEKQFRERHLGVLQGMTKKEFAEQYPEEYKKFISGDPDYQFPAGESARQRYERNLTGYRQVAASQEGKNILVIAHGGVLESLIRYTLKMPLEMERCFSLFNLSFNRFSVDMGKWFMEIWGDISHLKNLPTLDDN